MPIISEIMAHITWHKKNGHPVTETVWPITQFLCMPKAFPTFDLWEFD